MDYIIYFVITIGILVFIHEFGHFAAAKLSGMRADVFAIGFGKRLFGWNRKTGFTFGELPKDFDGEGHTDYRLSLLPLGGYVKIAGMIDESMDTDFVEKEPQPYEFRAKPVWAKIFVITAGVLMNLFLAWIIFWGANFFQGKPITPTTTIAFVEDGSPAQLSGFVAGDKILSINGKQVNNWEELRAQIFINTLGENLNVTLERNGAIKNLSIERKLIPDDESKSLYLLPQGIKPGIGDVLKDSPAEKSGLKPGDIMLSLNGIPLYSPKQTTELISANRGREIQLVVKRKDEELNISVTPGDDSKIGVAIGPVFLGKTKMQTYGAFASIYYGWKDIEKMTALTFQMVGKVFSGNIEVGKAFGGPIKIAQIAAKSADSGISSFLYFLALLSLSLAILNIMPFPVLDGGHLVMIIIEAIIRREIPVKIKVALQNTGFVILLLLMAFIIYNDIISL
ncbi:MAG: RIP metalloprotease RseP [Ignavibacteriales bacterium]|nr:RIP metalloprotease RseP [Ignavibacterium sp.]MCO6446456.1 RIP metalloprotease RseP [Ignavibacterium album]MCZ2269702.1 RIP metalloprotease RseP [Ignavibacteriales bacterium]HOJ07351.1 RIP metalloprotease RseP [Ignavibacteriaceae bacterium]